MAYSAKTFLLSAVPANIYLFKGNNRSTRKRCEICLKLTIKIPQRVQCYLIMQVFIYAMHAGFKK